MRIIFLGTGEFGVESLTALIRAGHEVVQVVSQPNRPAGRGRAVQPTAIHAHADRLGLSHLQTADINALAPSEIAHGAELGVVAAFGQKIGPAWLQALPRGMINLHASLLPRYRGAAPFQWAILNGDATTGVTVFQLDERWDAGPVWGRRETPIGELETADELHDRLALLGAEMLPDCLVRIARNDAPMPQDATAATRAPKLTKADGFVDWTLPAARVARRIHGLWSWPGAAVDCELCSGKRERILLSRARVAEVATAEKRFAPGELDADGAVACGEGRVLLLEVKPAGGKLMSFDAFRNGRSGAPHGGLLRLLPPTRE
ncbi:MAG: methionyl-tRNA formyltransferase [Phycisphaerae bacterium]